jgi:hypothetical protein
LKMRIVPSVRPSEQTPRAVEREFRGRLESGAKILPAGEARSDPLGLLACGYVPRHKLELFDCCFYLTRPGQNPDLRFFVAYVVPAGQERKIHPRIFYKDISLVWRSASHYARSENENWIGKGETRTVVENGETWLCSAEETTDLPLELQTALETLNHAARRVPRDDVAVSLVLRRAPDRRIEPYRDFVEPRRRARANPRNLVHGGRPVARFTRKGDPTSLRFARGYEPDFGRGILEVAASTSRMYGGRLQRYRILSRNRRIQYLFFAGPRQVWIVPPQATTTELTSYGVRTIDVHVPEELCIPGYEYHFLDDSVQPPVLVSQIPERFVGAASEVDASRSDASPWLERLPVIREFRRRVLSRRSP